MTILRTDEPTAQLRFLKRTVMVNKFDALERFILQQAFRVGDGEYEWRDIPLVDEETGEPVGG